MKEKELKLAIHNPCYESWEKMSLSNNGRFCSRCAKTVTDFTGMTEKEIFKTIQQSNGKLCGRLNKHQLDHPILSQQAAPSSLSAVFKLIIGLSLLGLPKTIQASSQMATVAPTFPKDTIQIPHATTKKRSEIAPSTQERLINGTVFDKDSNIPIPGVNVMINAKIHAVTDMDGKFQLLLPDDFAEKKFNIIYSFIGFEQLTQSFGLADLPLDNLQVNLYPSTELMGEIVIINRPKKWWQFWKKKNP